VDDTVDYLEYIAKNENIKYEIDALNIIAQKADGAMRDALSIFDQVTSFSGSNITYQNVIENLNVLDYDYYFKLTDAFVNGQISDTLLTFSEIIDKGFDAHHFINGLSEHFRNILVSRDEITLQLLEVGASIRERYKEQTKICTQDFLFSALEISNKCDVSYRLSKNKRLHVELALIELCNITNEKKKSSLNEKQGEVKKNEPVNENKDYKSESEKNEIKEKEKKVEEPEKKPKKNIQIGKAGSFSTFSIKDKLKQDAEPAQQVQETEGPEYDRSIELQREAFNEKELIEKWHAFSNKMGDRPRIFNTLTSKDPKLEENSIVSFVIDNNLQEEKINEIRNELIVYLKKELRNDDIVLKLLITDLEEENNKLYTTEDKFNHMLAKNQDLAKLKKEFNLDLE
jgi:DNA polymerase-3 subunit gamma/tau